VEFSGKRDTMLSHRQANGLETFLLMNEQETFQIITRELINTVRDRLQYIYLDMRRIVPNTREHDLMMECVREALTPHLPFTTDKMEVVVDEAYALFLNFMAVEQSK
jgi:hypothetical protein